MWMKVFERQTIESAAALHFLNVGEHQEAIHFGFKSPSFILPNGTLLRMDGQPFDSCVLPHNGRIDGKIKILFLGRLHEKKGVELLLRAFSCLDASNKNLHLIVAGPAKPGYLAKLKSMSADFSIRCCDITWLGMVSGQLKESLLATADIFVLPSRQEGDSIAVKEAMSFGLPVIISKACRFPEVETNQAGIVVENEVADIVSALNWFCDHPDARKRFGENGRCLVEKEYRWDKIGRELLGVYRDIINGTKTSPRWVG
jgi:glycosyltransferase involved in cell wall biosynthesis